MNRSVTVCSVLYRRGGMAADGDRCGGRSFRRRSEAHSFYETEQERRARIFVRTSVGTLYKQDKAK